MAAEIWFELNDFREARRLFLQADDSRSVLRCKAELALENSEWGQSAHVLSKVKDWRRLAHLLEQPCRYSEAVEAVRRCEPEVQAASLGKQAMRATSSLLDKILPGASNMDHGVSVAGLSVLPQFAPES